MNRWVYKVGLGLTWLGAVLFAAVLLVFYLPLLAVEGIVADSLSPARGRPDSGPSGVRGASKDG